MKLPWCQQPQLLRCTGRTTWELNLQHAFITGLWIPGNPSDLDTQWKTPAFMISEAKETA